ncbi:hypothetical protein L2E82_36180 [Cichorium intybus]|uniref:Uncharacterized protein n=1 Tax=Cichorium intybus TaxID=13427 RepID=A0ACB9BQV0_CICIN|nr:hypothetical protein L2E82_36180 [Cichorium intybus]
MNNLNERKEKENADLIANNKHLTEQLEKTMQANQSLEDFVKMLTFVTILNATSKKDALQLVNQELNNKISELQNAQKSTIAKHAEECRVAEDKFLKLKSQAETLLSKKTATENLGHFDSIYQCFIFEDSRERIVCYDT